MSPPAKAFPPPLPPTHFRKLGISQTASLSLPLSPIGPPGGVRAVRGHHHGPLIPFIISPNRVNGATTKRPPENKAAWIGFNSRVTLDDLSVKYREINLIKCEVICLGFLVGMITYADHTLRIAPIMLSMSIVPLRGARDFPIPQKVCRKTCADAGHCGAGVGLHPKSPPRPQPMRCGRLRRRYDHGRQRATLGLASEAYVIIPRSTRVQDSAELERV